MGLAKSLNAGGKELTKFQSITKPVTTSRVERRVMAIIWIRVEGRVLRFYCASFRVVFSTSSIRFVVGGSGTILAFPRHSYSDLDRRLLSGEPRVHAPARGGKTVRSSSSGNVWGFGSVFQRRLLHLPFRNARLTPLRDWRFSVSSTIPWRAVSRRLRTN